MTTEPNIPPPEPPLVEDFPGGWHMVTYQGWQVTVANDASIRLPQLVRCDDIDAFTAACQAAKPVAEAQRAANEEAASKVSVSNREARMIAMEKGMIRRVPPRSPQEKEAQDAG